MPNALDIAAQGTLSPYEPSFRERAANALNQYWYGDTRKGQEQANRLLDVLDMTGLVSMGNALAAGPGGSPVDMAMAFAPGPAKKAIRAFHGSPHDFDRFDMSRIGTGEGAQAYGHGLYFAENEATAKAYNEQLSKLPKQVTDVLKESGYLGFDNAGQAARAVLDYPDWAQRWDIDPMRSEAERRVFETLQAFRKREIPLGRMYEVSINADPEQFLDWDRPLSEQSEAARKAIIEATIANKPWLDESTIPNAPGSDLYHQLAFKNPADARQHLQKAGIPGIKYLDQGSRGKGDGTRNYVVFDDKLIEIIRKYGLAPFALGTLGYGANQQDTEQPY